VLFSSDNKPPIMDIVIGFGQNPRLLTLASSEFAGLVQVVDFDDTNTGFHRSSPIGWPL